MRYIVLLSVLSVMASGCAGEPTAPSQLPRFTRGNLEFGTMGMINTGGLHYKITAQLSETGGVDITVTEIQVQALSGSDVLATASVIPMLSISANSTSAATGLVFDFSSLQNDLSAVKMTVQFRDANGNTGSVSKSFTCFGCLEW
jgi:hypothetical protein